jgi:hypothetical protein
MVMMAVTVTVTVTVTVVTVIVAPVPAVVFAVIVAVVTVVVVVMSVVVPVVPVRLPVPRVLVPMRRIVSRGAPARVCRSFARTPIDRSHSPTLEPIPKGRLRSLLGVRERRRAGLLRPRARGRDRGCAVLECNSWI